MADHSWLKHLAHAQLVNGCWRHADGQAVQGLISARVENAVQALFDEASEASEIFNSHVHISRRIRVLRVAPKPGETGGGFMLLLGRCQLTLEVRAEGVAGSRLPILVATFATVAAFIRNAHHSRRFLPQCDTFGTIVWRDEGALLMNHELIVKRLFEDLLRIHFENGEAISAPELRSHQSQGGGRVLDE